MINVCYTVDAPYVGGAEQYITRLATRLDRNRFRPSVIMGKPGSSETGLEQWRATIEAAGVLVTTVPMDLPRKPHRIGRVFRELAALEPRIVHVNMPGPQDGQMGLLVPLSRMAGASGVVVTEHLPMVESTWKRKLLKRISYNWVDRVATVCHANVRYLVEKQFVPRGKVEVIHNAVDRSFGCDGGGEADNVKDRYHIPSRRVVVVFVGNLLEHKGLHRIIHVLSEAPELPWHLLVVGDGPERENCEQKLRSLDMSERASFAGKVPAPEVEKLLRQADVLALPSTTEGMPYVILEAMAASLPVVSTNVYGIPEMVVDGETGLLVEPGDHPGLARALHTLIRNGNSRTTMGREARSRFEQRFTMESQMTRIEQLYEQLAGLPSGSRQMNRRVSS